MLRVPELGVKWMEYVKRMKRSTLSLEDATTLACSVDEVNVPFNGGITYVNRVVTILDMTNMAVIRRCKI